MMTPSYSPTLFLCGAAGTPRVAEGAGPADDAAPWRLLLSGAGGYSLTGRVLVPRSSLGARARVIERYS